MYELGGIHPTRDTLLKLTAALRFSRDVTNELLGERELESLPTGRLALLERRRTRFPVLQQVGRA